MLEEEEEEGTGTTLRTALLTPALMPSLGVDGRSWSADMPAVTAAVVLVAAAGVSAPRGELAGEATGKCSALMFSFWFA